MTSTSFPSQYKPRLASWKVMLGTSLLAASLFYIRFGYGFGYSDQDEFLPLAMHWLDGDLFVKDWFVQWQASSFGIRSGMAGLVAAVGLLLPLNLGVLLIHVLVWLGLSFGLYRICNRLYHNDLVSFLFIITVTVVTARWNPGGNAVFHSMLVPSSLSWAFGIWSLERLLAGRVVTAGLWSAIAILVQPLVGLQIAAILLVAQILISKTQIWKFAIPVVLVALPVVWAFNSIGSGAGVGAEFDATYLLATLRAPHHYLPGAFPAMSWVTWFFVALVGAYVFWTDRVGLANGPSRRLISTVGWISVAVVMLAIPLITLFESSLAIRLQPFNVSVLGRVVFLMGFCGLLVHYLPKRIIRAMERGMYWGGFPAAMTLILIWAIVIGRPAYTKWNGIESPEESSLVLDDESAAWIEAFTPIDAVFAIPPGISGFQVRTKRAQYANFKAFPFEASTSNEWLSRLLDIAPVVQLEPGGSPLLARFEESYATSSISRWRAQLRELGIDYIVRAQSPENEWPINLAVWCNQRWCVFESNSPGLNFN